MKNIVAALAVGCIASVVGAAGFDGKSLTTNDWFDASFTALTADTVIAQGGTTGITRGAGSWSAVPATGTAVIAADADAGGEATLLAISAPDEELTFTPAALAATSGLETVSAEIKADAIDELPALGADVQAAFTVYLDGNGVLSAQGWTAAGWTNLASAAASSLTNAWFTLYLDFAKEGGVRYVRYSVKPAEGALAVLADADGATWFQAGRNADVVSSVSFSGIGSVRAFSGDELEVLGVATYNGAAYQTFEAAIAAGVADGWAHGNVLLLADAEWSPTVTGTYNIDVNGHGLTVNGAVYTSEGYVYTVSGFKYYWIGPADGEWASNSNWSRTEGGSAAGAYPSDTDDAEFPSDATVAISSGNANVNNLTLRGNVTITGATEISISKKSGKTNSLNCNKLIYSSISGPGKVLTLKTAGVSSGAANAAIDCDINVPTGYKAAFHCNLKTILMNGRLTGGGEIIEFQAGNDNGITYSADCSGFSGTVTEKIVNDYQRSHLRLSSGAVSFRNATINSMSYEFSKNAQYLFGTAQDTYYIGAFNGPLQGWESKITLYIGGKGEDCSISGTFARDKKNTSTWPSTLIKEGAARVTSTCVGIAYLEIQNGTFEIANLSPMYDSSVSPWIKFTGGKLACTPVDGVAFDPSAYIKGSTSAIVFDDEGHTNSWATALAASNVGGFTKSGSGRLTLEIAPAYSGATVVSGGVLVVPGGTVLDSLSVAEGASFIVDAEDGDTITIKEFAEGTDSDSVTKPVGSSVAWTQDAETGYWTGTFSRGPLTYTWTGAMGDCAWGNGGNWKIDGVAATLPPMDIDTIVFPAEGVPQDGWAVTLDEMKTVEALRVEGDTAFTGARIQVVNGAETAGVSGAGKITVGNSAGFYTGSGDNKQLTIENDLEIVADADHFAKVQGRIKTSSSGGASITLNGNLTGSGCLEMGGTRSNTYLNGTNTEFRGSIRIPDDSATAGARRLNVYIKDSYASSSNAVWEIYNTAEDGKGDILRKFGSTYCFGALMGNVNNSKAASRSASVVEIGAANIDFELVFKSINYNGRRDTIVKRGTGTMTMLNGTSDIGTYNVAAGTLFVTTAAGMPKEAILFNGGTLKTGYEMVEEEAVPLDPSALIKNSASPIAFDDQGTNRTWATALAASNVGGFTKKGAGMLTLSAAPLYTGLTTVEEGTLVVPSDSDITYNPFSAGTLSGVSPSKFGYPVDTTLTGAEAAKSFDGSLDISNVTAIDASGATLVHWQPYVIASATTAITGYTKASLENIALTLPDGVDTSKWKLSVRTIEGKHCLCLVDFDMGSMLILH